MRLLEKIRGVGTPLKQFAASPLTGIKTGYNDAFLMDTAARDRLVAEHAESKPLFRPYLRGEDVDRWRTGESGQWMLALRSSANHDWPWANAADEADAEGIFAKTYPAVHAHMSRHKEALQKRQDQGKFWWELRSCAYYDKFDRPKIAYQEIQYHPCYMLDGDGRMANNKVLFIPSADLYLLGVLNSPLMWWYCWRHLPHMKDEALYPAAYKMDGLPVAQPSDEVRAGVEARARRLIEITAAYATGLSDVMGWLRAQLSVEKPTQRLEALGSMDADGLVAEVKKVRGNRKPLSVADVRLLKEEHARTVVPLQAQLAEAARLEREVCAIVNQAYGLRDEEVALLWHTAPPRMPIPGPEGA